MPSETQAPHGQRRRIRLAYLVSHPIQYQAPLLRRIAQEPDIDLTVFFGSDFSLRNYADKGFGVTVKWDVPLVEGYKHEFLPALRDNGTVSPFTPISRGILNRLSGRGTGPAFDMLWVHGYASVNALQGIFAAKALGIPVLLRAEPTLIDRPRSTGRLAGKELFFRTLRHLISGVAPIGTLNSEYWKHYLSPDIPSFPMPYCVDNAYFHARSTEAQQGRADLQDELGIDPSRPVILFASKLQERKRCIDLMEAYLQVITRPGLKPYLVIVGDGEERATLEARAAQSGVDSIRFCGFRNQSELPRFFDLATVFVLPSRHEPWGLIVNEAMNAGRPVILSNDVGCQPDLVTDGVEGFVFPVGNVNSLASALVRLLEDPGCASRMGLRALKKIQEYDFEADVRGLRAAAASLTRIIAEKSKSVS
ncbi:glycosyltransferase involved in cell wall biosynthesis [Granulicella aggregans]|uniref:Glycosyltransferase involved in cell wall biosynthesis n=1 Tax=Granulicella aggregans TaxID=474949 RepID=A0A7W7ZIA8_9BACT|nr:glycosyltransferase family 4 protein [Granulicella aggregans]MBB5059741.1 glycosyltransferase involved in cell wall biosynthesis [Granulicella aggregans]